MLSLNHHTVLVSFRNTTQKFIINSTMKSTNEFVKFFKEYEGNLLIDKITLLDLKDNKFKRVSENLLISIFSFNIDFVELIENY